MTTLEDVRFKLWCVDLGLECVLEERRLSKGYLFSSFSSGTSASCRSVVVSSSSSCGGSASNRTRKTTAVVAAGIEIAATAAVNITLYNPDKKW